MGRFQSKLFLITVSLLFLAIALSVSAAQCRESPVVQPDGDSALSIEDIPSAIRPVINSIVIKGNSHYRRSFLRKWLETAIVDGKLNIAAFKKSMMNINGLPDLEAEASFAPSTQKEAYDLILNVMDRKNVHLRFTYDNFGTVSSGENRMICEMSLSSLLSCGDSLMMKLIDPISNKNSVSQYYVTYSVPINTRGTRMSLAASSIDTMIPASPDDYEMETFDTYELIRNSQIYTLSFTSPIECSKSLNSNIISGITAKHYGEHRKEFLFDTYDEVRFVFFGLNREEKHGALKLNYSLQLSQGLGTFLGGMEDDCIYSRKEMVTGRYTRLSGSFQIRQNLGKKNYFNLRGAGQISNSRLPISEEFPIGGPDSVRGYAKNEYRGDDGFFMNAEYRHQLVASDKGRSPLEAILFYDFGRVRTINTQANELSDKNIQGAGIGFRVAAGSSTDIRLDCGWPIKPPDNKLKRNPYIYTQMTIRL